MSRRKQSNPKPLKNESTHDTLEYPSETDENKGEIPNWKEKSSPTNNPLPVSEVIVSDKSNNMVTVLETSSKKSDSSPLPDHRPASVVPDEDRKSPPKIEPEEKQPRIRLKAGLATDPALNMLSNVKTEADFTKAPTEYLASLTPTIQSALVNRGLIFQTNLNTQLNEAVAAVAAAQRVASNESIRTVSTEIAVPPELTTRQSVPNYQCIPCGIRFSSRSTLEAHQTYYCSHRPNKPIDDDSKQAGSTNSDPNGNHSETETSDTVKVQRIVKQYTCTHCSYSADKKVSLNRHMRMHTASPLANASTQPAVTSNTSSVLSNGEATANEIQDRYCAECDIRFSSQKTYRAHKMHYCNSRHVVKPAVPPSSSCTSGSSPTSPTDKSACQTPPSPVPQLSTAQQPFLALPTNPIIIVPYSLFQSASVLPSLSTPAGVPSPDAPCFLLPNGTIQPMINGMNISIPPPPLLPPPPKLQQQQQQQSQSDTEPVLKTINKGNKEPSTTSSREVMSSAVSTTPLDLTVRKSPELYLKRNKSSTPMEIDLDHEKDNVKERQQSMSPEKIECEPIILSSSSPCSGIYEKSSPNSCVSPKRKMDDLSRSNSPRASKTPKLSDKMSKNSPETTVTTMPAFDLSSSPHPLLMRTGNLALFPPELQMRLSELTPIQPVMPQVIVKQGVSKCKECNIVFCKYENYMAHKKHYCSSRGVEDDSSKTSGSPPVSPSSGGATSPAAQYQQLICLTCGIKFTSPDNLNAHQQYYCMKRNDLEPKKCLKCRAIVEPGHLCISRTTLTGWKCPLCDVVSATSSTAQRHMETHTGIKAYICTVCKYKGNTLRGMKTHVKMHFEKRSPDFREEQYIDYILEENSMTSGIEEVAIAAPSSLSSLATDDRSSPNSLENRPELQHTCSQCPYSSPYKANVVRHIKLVHEMSIDEHLNSNGEIKVDTTTSSNSNSSNSAIIHMPHLDEDDEIIVKKEAIEPEVIIAHLDGTATIKEEPELSLTPKLKLSDEEMSQETTVITNVTTATTTAAAPTKIGPPAHHCKSCDIYFNYIDSFRAHKRYYCSSHAGEITSNANNNNNNSNNNKNTATRTAETSVL